MTIVAPARGPAFADDLRTRGGRLAVLTSDSALTYAELADRVDAMAARLGRDRRLVMVTASNTADALVAYLGALRGGHVVLLAAGEKLIDVYDPDVFIDGDIISERRAGSAHELHPDLALLLSTSGSTGSPKLVRLSRRNLESNASAIAEYLGLTEDDRAITTLPMQYCYGLSVINSHLDAGASLVLTELSVVDRCFWDLFRKAGATSFSGVPHTFDLLERADFESMTLPTLRYVTQAGGRMDPSKVRTFAELGAARGWDFVVMYGQTEATARMAYLPPSLAAMCPGAIGVPIPGGELRVDRSGELLYRGPNVMMGYAESADDLARGQCVDELRTGDLARVNAHGLFEVVGRKSRIVKPFGVRVDLDAVERFLADDGVVAACAGDDDALIVATDADRDVAEMVGRRLGLPRTHVRVVSGIPRLANGKPDYAALARSDAPAAVRGDTVSAVYAEILGVEPDADDTFVSLGGDSLSYVEVSVRLEEIIGNLPRDWHTTPVKDLAAAPRRRGAVAATDTSVVVRAVAIFLVLSTHADLFELQGGAHALLAVAGFNFGRFHGRAAAIAVSIGRIVIPSVLWISAVAVLSDQYGWPNALLAHGITERPGDDWGYWFIEALVYILVPLAVLLAIPAVARFDRARPFTVAMLALGAGLVVRFDVIDLTASHPTVRPHGVLWLFAIGWAAATATTWRHRAAVSAVAVMALPGFLGNPVREAIILAAALLITWLPSIPLPRLAHRAVAPIAAASLYIYLTHYQVYQPVQRVGGSAVAVAASLAVGVAVWLLVRERGGSRRRIFDRHRLLHAPRLQPG